MIKIKAQIFIIWEESTLNEGKIKELNNPKNIKEVRKPWKPSNAMKYSFQISTQRNDICVIGGNGAATGQEALRTRSSLQPAYSLIANDVYTGCLCDYRLPL